MREREIKFRAWNGVNIIGNVDVGGGKHVVHYMDDGYMGDNYVIREYKKDIIMQYTGLKDKNGVEIYEKDIVYIAGQGNRVIEFPFIELYESSYENDIGDIIGNIYQNPELLDNK